MESSEERTKQRMEDAQSCGLLADIGARTDKAHLLEQEQATVKFIRNSFVC